MEKLEFNQNKEENFTENLMTEASQALIYSLKEHFNNPNIDTIWGDVLVGFATVPTSSIEIHIDSERDNLQKIFENGFKEEISKKKIKIDRYTKITKLKRDLTYGNKEQKDKPIEKREAISHGSRVII